MGEQPAEAETTGEAGSDTAPEITDAIYRSGTGGKIRTRIRQLKLWFLLTASRWRIAGLLLAVTFAIIVLVGAFGPVSVRQFLSVGVSPGSVLVELLKAIITVVTIVLTINSLVLSPNLGPVSDQREILEDAMSLRTETEDVLDSAVTPLSPREFLRELVSAVGARARTLPTPEGSHGNDEEVRNELEQYSETVAADADRVAAALDGAKFGKFEVIPVIMGFDTSGKIRTARRIRREYSETLSEEDQRALEDMVDVLELFVTARAYLKTIYIRAEFINFSRALLYLGFPTIVLTFLATQLYGDNAFPGTTFGVANQLWFVSASVTVSLVPFVLLTAYSSRLVTLSQSTLFLAPFVAEGQHPDGNSDG